MYMLNRPIPLADAGNPAVAKAAAISDCLEASCVLREANVPHLVPQTLPDFSPPRGGLVPEPRPADPCVIVFPGGGYVRHADHEAWPVAGWLNSIGISAFVCYYRVAPERHPVPLSDAVAAIRFVREHAAEFNVDPARIGVLGFSAGGHLAATVSNLAEPADRPAVSILCYPVISMTDHIHQGSRDSLLGEGAQSSATRELSMENRVDAHTPPTFLWHTAEDASVPVENSLMYASALSRAKRPFEMHVFPEGFHGLGVAAIGDKRFPHAAQWLDLCRNWLRERGF